MLATKEHVNGHFEVTQTSWATDYVWVPGEEEVEERPLDEVLHPWHAAYAQGVKEERAHPEEQLRIEMQALGEPPKVGEAASAPLVRNFLAWKAQIRFGKGLGCK